MPLLSVPGGPAGQTGVVVLAVKRSAGVQENRGRGGRNQKGDGGSNKAAERGVWRPPGEWGESALVVAGRERRAAPPSKT